MTTESGVLSNTRYSFHTRFIEGIGTNPDELIAASLGGCFSMALANELGLAGFHPERIETTATATLEELAKGWTLTRIDLDVHANIPDASQASFMDAALTAKANCPISRLLRTNISMTASLTHNPKPEGIIAVRRPVIKTIPKSLRRNKIHSKGRRKLHLK
jgi:osmotically inducible protein OsmC